LALTLPLLQDGGNIRELSIEFLFVIYLSQIPCTRNNLLRLKQNGNGLVGIGLKKQLKEK
jgi:hypothetical protein